MKDTPPINSALRNSLWSYPVARPPHFAGAPAVVETTRSYEMLDFRALPGGADVGIEFYGGAYSFWLDGENVGSTSAALSTSLSPRMRRRATPSSPSGGRSSRWSRRPKSSARPRAGWRGAAGSAPENREVAKCISVIVGKADAGDGSEVLVYRALRPLLCSSCGAAIGEGSLFTRRALADGGLRVAAWCMECAPFTWRDGDGEGRRRSPLLESLFAPQAEGERGQRGAAESVKERLGLALRYRAGKKGTGG